MFDVSITSNCRGLTISSIEASSTCMVVDGYVGEFLGHASDDLAPEQAGGHDVGLGDQRQLLAALRASLKPSRAIALDLVLVVDLGVPDLALRLLLRAFDHARSPRGPK